jgi:hypothetical protein
MTYSPSFTRTITSGRAGRYTGGLGGGGVAYLPPELDMSDYVDDFAPTSVTLSRTYIVATQCWWGAGEVEPRAGDIKRGYSWAEAGDATAAGSLVFYQHSYSGTTITRDPAVKFDNSRRFMWAPSAASAWGIQTHANTADRTYDWPDNDMRVMGHSDAALLNAGDLAVGQGEAAGAAQWAPLAIGLANTVLTSDGTDPSWQYPNKLVVTNVSGATTLNATHHVVIVDTSGGAVTITLPASPVTGQSYRIKNAATSGNSVTVARNGKNIENAASDLTLLDLDAVDVVYDGTEWWVL